MCANIKNMRPHFNEMFLLKMEPYSPVLDAAIQFH